MIRRRSRKGRLKLKETSSTFSSSSWAAWQQQQDDDNIIFFFFFKELAFKEQHVDGRMYVTLVVDFCWPSFLAGCRGV